VSSGWITSPSLNVGENSCNSGDGKDQRVQSLMFMMMMMMKIQLVYRRYYFERNSGKTQKVVWLFTIIELIDKNCDIEPKKATQFLHLVPLFLINEVGNKAPKASVHSHQQGSAHSQVGAITFLGT
jgi:hypothetical protein